MERVTKLMQDLITRAEEAAQAADGLEKIEDTMQEIVGGLTSAREALTHRVGQLMRAAEMLENLDPENYEGDGAYLAAAQAIYNAAI